MAIINFLAANFFNITICAISILFFLVISERFKLQNDFLFWSSLGLISFLAPLAYVQGFLATQRLIQGTSAGMLLLSLSRMRSNKEIDSEGTPQSLNRTMLIGPTFGIFILYVYIAFRTLYLGQLLTLTVFFTPLYLLIAIFQKVSFNMGLKVLLGYLIPINVINFFTVSLRDFSLANLTEVISGRGEKFFGIFLSNHNSAFIAAILLLALSYYPASVFKKTISFVGIVIILLSGSRGILFPLLLICVFQFSLLFPEVKKSKKISAAFVGLVLIIFISAFVFRNDPAIRSLTGRTEAWSFYYGVIMQSPILGSGAGIDELNVSERLISRILNTPHNGFITIAAYGGLIMLSVFLISLYSVWQALRSSQVNDRTARVIFLFLVLSMFSESRLNFLMPTYSTYVLVLILSTIYFEHDRKVINKEQYK